MGRRATPICVVYEERPVASALAKTVHALTLPQRICSHTHRKAVSLGGVVSLRMSHVASCVVCGWCHGWWGGVRVWCVLFFDTSNPEPRKFLSMDKFLRTSD